MLKTRFIRFLKDEEGATAVEYGLILSLLVIAIIGAIRSTGTSTSGALTRASNGFAP